MDHEQLEALERLAAAKEAGLLTDTEVEEEKKKIIQGNQKAPSPSGDSTDGARPLVEGMSRDAKRGLGVALGGLVIVIAILLNQQGSAGDEENRVRQNARDNADEMWEGMLDRIDKAKDG